MAPEGVDIPGYKEFMDDINALTTEQGSWVITFLAASGQNEQEFAEQVHFGYGGTRGDSSFGAGDLLISDIAQADELMNEPILPRLQHPPLTEASVWHHPAANDFRVAIAPAILQVFLRRHTSSLRDFVALTCSDKCDISFPIMQVFRQISAGRLDTYFLFPQGFVIPTIWEAHCGQVNLRELRK